MIQSSTCLWFDSNAEEAVDFYLSVFPGGKRLRAARYPDVPVNERPPSWPAAGSVLTVEFEMLGHRYIALNGGPMFQFNEAVSLVIECDTQEEVDHYWDALTADGGTPVQCGWLRDKFGLSWQITPRVLGELMTSDDPALVARVTRAMLTMVKLDIATLEAAANSASV